MIALAELGWALRQPAWLWFAPLVAAAILLRWRRRPRLPLAAAALLRGPLADRLELPPLPRSLRQRLAALLPALELGGLLLVVVALAGPVQRVPLPPERQGIDLVLCVDRSSSMLATDLSAAADRTRLALAVGAAAEFAAARRDDRVGVVTFARFADLLVPPTLDHAAIADLLAAVEPVEPEGPEDATGIGTALSFAVEALQRAATAAKVVVLLTDGEENVATRAAPQEIAPLHAAQLARQLGVRVHTIAVGAGKPGGDGTLVPLDTTVLQQAAALTGGRFFRARDGAALAAIYRDIDALERTQFAEPRVLVREFFALALLLAVVAIASALWGATAARGELP